MPLIAHRGRLHVPDHVEHALTERIANLCVGNIRFELEQNFPRNVSRASGRIFGCRKGLGMSGMYGEGCQRCRKAHWSDSHPGHKFTLWRSAKETGVE